jgi:tripartite-type tricarboxylate transporter receptor subunit TctC
MRPGLPGYESFIWFGLFGPKALDGAIAERLNQAVKKALALSAVREKMTSLGNVPRYETVEQFQATVKADRAKWAEVVKTSGASID